jgi:hypothetical protein
LLLHIAELDGEVLSHSIAEIEALAGAEVEG